MNKYDCLKLESQLCFPLYAASKKIIQQYTPVLNRLDLTYTQYITMLTIWEYKSLSVKELGTKLYLDSGTLTPLLKKLQDKEYITRERLKEDERTVIISLTKKGIDLKEKALEVPKIMSKCTRLTEEEGEYLYNLLYKLLKD